MGRINVTSTVFEGLSSPNRRFGTERQFSRVVEYGGEVSGVVTKNNALPMTRDMAKRSVESDHPCGRGNSAISDA
jgi:hypothetical protein